jgi:hypothetical protein
MKKSFLRKHGKSETSKCKARLQALLRQIALIRDKRCILRGNRELKPCSGYREDGELVLQYDHLNSRQFNISYADVRLGVILCKGHHGWKHFTDANKKQYDRIVRGLIGEARAKLWDRVEADRKMYPMALSDWLKLEIALAVELKTLENAT